MARCRALACDFDGTLTDVGRLAPEAAAVLRQARAVGIVTLLVTGRVLENLRDAGVDFGAFDGVVAENGAVLWFPGTDRTIALGEPPPERFFGELRARGIPFHAGAVIVGMADHHAAQVLDLVRRLGLDSQLVFNRAALMILPSGVNKALGVRRALEELGRSERNLVAIGDAENDLPMLVAAELGVAARASVPSLVAVADDRLSLPGGEGVVHWLRQLLARGGEIPASPRRCVTIGRDDRGGEVRILAAGRGVLVSGDPHSGKSWVAGLIAERLYDQGYCLCVIDPEGDHLHLGRRPRFLVLGEEVSLPAPAAVARLFRSGVTGLVLSLVHLPHERRAEFLATLLAALEAERGASGLPHWLVIDEAHYFFHTGSPLAEGFSAIEGSVLLATYRPSMLAPEVHAAIASHVVTRTAIDEERYFLTTLLQPHGLPEGTAPRFADVAFGRAGLLERGTGGATWREFEPGERLCPHVHHGRKYADMLVPEARSFRFLGADGHLVASARSVEEFCAAACAVPFASLRRHLAAGDFSEWVERVIGDPELAAGLRKLERTARMGTPPSRAEIVAHVRARYFVGVVPIEPGAGRAD